MTSDISQRLNLKIEGQGSQTILFAQGLGLNQNIWRLLLPEFVESYRVVRFDYRKETLLDKSRTLAMRYSSLNGYTKDIIEICDLLELRDCIFIGHSISSMIGLVAALEKPEAFQNMVFIGPSPRFVNDIDGYVGGFDQEKVELMLKAMQDDYAKWARETLPDVVNTSDKKLEQEIIDMFVANDKEVLQQFALATFFSDHRKELLRFKKPCLVIQTNADLMIPLQVGQYLHAHLSNSLLKVLKGKGHFPQLTAAAELTSVIKNYLAQSD